MELRNQLHALHTDPNQIDSAVNNLFTNWFDDTFSTT